MKKQQLILALLGLSILLFACESNEKTRDDLIDISEYMDSAIDLTNKYENYSNDFRYSLEEYPLKVDGNQSYWDQTAYGKMIYYIGAEDNMSNLSNHISIYSYDTTNGKTNVIHNYEIRERATFYSELRATNDYLFFVETPADGLISLNRIDLRTKELKSIYTSNHSFPVISVTDEYVSWYESYLNNNESICCDLNIYSIINDTTEVIKESPTSPSSFSRPHITNNHIVYHSSSNETDKTKVTIMNLDTKKTIKMLIPGQIVNVMSNGKITVWHNYYSWSDVFVFDHEENQLYLAHSLTSVGSLFSVSLLQDLVFINFSSDSEG